MTAPNRRWPRIRTADAVPGGDGGCLRDGVGRVAMELTDFEFGSGSGYIDPLGITVLLSGIVAAIVFVAWIFWPNRRDEP